MKGSVKMIVKTKKFGKKSLNFDGSSEYVDTTTPEIGRIRDAILELGKVLRKEKVIKGRKWHTVQFFFRNKGIGFAIDEFKVYDVKKDFKSLDGI